MLGYAKCYYFSGSGRHLNSSLGRLVFVGQSAGLRRHKIDGNCFATDDN